MLLSIVSIAKNGFSFWYRKFKNYFVSYKFLQITIAPTTPNDHNPTSNMDFDALMRKKLGGKYDKPIENEVPKNMDSVKEGQEEIILTPPPKESQAKTQNRGQKKATFKPRVTCSQCDFVGVAGKEMEIHRKKHETSFDYSECQLVSNYKVVLRRHEIGEHNKKCESCQFTAATSASLKMHSQAEHGGGMLTNSAGFMITNDAPNDVSVEEMATNEESNIGMANIVKKLTKCQYLKREKEVKVENKSKKNILRSFKDSFMTLKKKIANLQKQHGTEGEYLIIVKNNLQLPGGKTPSPTGGQFMVYGEGLLLTELLSTGLIFDGRFVLMANEYNMETKEVNREKDNEMVEGT